jgi:hypothetical protein
MATLPVDDPKVKAAIEDLAKLTAKPTESMADVVEGFEEKQDDFQGMYNAGGSFARKLEEIAGSFRKGGVETEPSYAKAAEAKPVERVTEILTEPEVEKKLEEEGYIEKVEKTGETQQVMVDDYTQQILLKPAVSQSPRVILPLTEEEVRKGLHQKVWESIRWLAEWCARQLRMLSGRAEYKKSN